MNLINKWENKLDILKLVKEHYQRVRKYNLLNSIEQDINLIEEFIKDLKKYEI
jgi:hypothetical protein